jgi:hypothetical protein
MADTKPPLVDERFVPKVNFIPVMVAPRGMLNPNPLPIAKWEIVLLPALAWICAPGTVVFSMLARFDHADPGPVC